jgi:hypothetical protein
LAAWQAETTSGEQAARAPRAQNLSGVSGSSSSLDEQADNARDAYKGKRTKAGNRRMSTRASKSNARPGRGFFCPVSANPARLSSDNFVRVEASISRDFAANDGKFGVRVPVP